MVDLFFATCRENTTTGYAALMIEGRALPSDATARGEADRESKDIFKAILSRVPAEKEITVHLKSGERLLSEVSGKKLYKALAARGHPTVGVLVGIRLLLSEYGLISTKEVTSAIYDKLRNRFSSEAVAKIYNERYQQGQYAQSEVQ